MLPSGSSPTELDLQSHRYHHHTRIHTDGSTNWIGTTSHLTSEGGDGTTVVLFISTDGGTNWTAPVATIGSQSTMRTNVYTPGARFLMTRGFQKYGGTNYLIIEVDVAVNTGGNNNALALVACSLNSTGVISSFLITTNAYSATNGYAELDYNATLGPPLLAQTIIYGTWGHPDSGTIPYWGIALWDAAANRGYIEPNTFLSDDTGTNMLRLWRHYTGAPTTWLVYQSESTNAGVNWSLPVATQIPNHPSETAGIRLNDGRFAIVGNPEDYSGVNSGRDPLYFALTPPNSLTITNVSAIRQGMSITSSYAGFSKYGGAQYPALVQATSNMLVSYSVHKESVGFSKFPIPSYTETQTNQTRLTLNAARLNLIR
jgi:hypothetical protein